MKFNLDRYKSDARSNVKADLATLPKDPLEVNSPTQAARFKLNRPNSGMPNILTNRVGLMVSPKSIKDAAGGNADRIAVGTGPFKFVSWQDNDNIQVVKNADYWQKGLPHLDGITFKIINELNTAVRAVVAGEADLALNMQAAQKPVADRSKNVVATASPSLVPFLGFLNYGKPPLDKYQGASGAFWNYAVNRDEINKIAAVGLGQRRRARSSRRNTGPAMPPPRIITTTIPRRQRSC